MTDRTWSGVGKTAIVTGPTGTGIGLHTARWLAERGTFVVLAGRNVERLMECEKAIRVVAQDADGKPNGDAVHIQSIQCDTASLDSCDKFVEQFNALNRNLDLLISNAGIMAPPLTVTVDGLESQIGTNHVGHHYLAQKLLPKLKAAAPSRVVLLSSKLHSDAPKLDASDLSWIFHPTPKQYGRPTGLCDLQACECPGSSCVQQALPSRWCHSLQCPSGCHSDWTRAQSQWTWLILQRSDHKTLA